MSVIGGLVTDRTQRDADFGTDKGLYLAVDLNRVGEAMRYLMVLFGQYGYIVSVTSRTNWAMTDIPRQSDMDTYLRDLTALRKVSTMLSTTPEVPSTMNEITWQEANDIEQILVDIEVVIGRVIIAFRRLGSFGFYANTEPLPSAESDWGRNWKEMDIYDTTWAQWEDITFYVLMYGPLGRTWVELDALHLTWANWDVASFYQLRYGDFVKENSE